MKLIKYLTMENVMRMLLRSLVPFFAFSVSSVGIGCWQSSDKLRLLAKQLYQIYLLSLHPLYNFFSSVRSVPKHISTMCVYAAKGARARKINLNLSNKLLPLRKKNTKKSGKANEMMKKTLFSLEVVRIYKIFVFRFLTWTCLRRQREN